MQVVRLDYLMVALRNEKKGTLREAFDGERPDITPIRDKECTGIAIGNSQGGFSATFAVPIFIQAGVGYVFEEQA